MKICKTQLKIIIALHWLVECVLLQEVENHIVDLNVRPLPPKGTNFADQLTRNQQNTNVANQPLSAYFIPPKQVSSSQSSISSRNREPIFFLKNQYSNVPENSDLSNFKFPPPVTMSPFGQDLTESRLPSPRNHNPFLERNKMFNYRKPSNQNNERNFYITGNNEGNQNELMATQSTLPVLSFQPNSEIIGFRNNIQPPANLQAERKIDNIMSGYQYHEIETAVASLENKLQSVQKDIARFETNIDRFSLDPPKQSTNRVVLDPSNPALNGVLSIDSYLQSIKPSNLKHNVQSVHVNESKSIVPQLSSGFGTRIITNEAIVIPEAVIPENRQILTQGNVMSTTPETFTTYPNFREELFPNLENHAREDPRPAVNSLLGPQGRYGGGTNELKEDLGQRYGINDRRRPWDFLPGRWPQ